MWFLEFQESLKIDSLKLKTPANWAHLDLLCDVLLFVKLQLGLLGNIEEKGLLFLKGEE